MPYDDPPDDEPWYDEDEEEALEEAAAQCPECGGSIYIVTHKCPACGYWLSDADRRAMWPDASKPVWLKITAVVVLAILLLGALQMLF